MMALPYGEEIVIVDRTVWTQCTSVTDGRTDRQTDRITITKTVQRRASHGKISGVARGLVFIGAEECLTEQDSIKPMYKNGNAPQRKGVSFALPILRLNDHPPRSENPTLKSD